MTLREIAINEATRDAYAETIATNIARATQSACAAIQESYDAATKDVSDKVVMALDAPLEGESDMERARR